MVEVSEMDNKKLLEKFAEENGLRRRAGFLACVDDYFKAFAEAASQVKGFEFVPQAVLA